MRTETGYLYLQEFLSSGLYDLMPLETPLLKVSRPVAACSRCRAAKIKCDGKLPACTACERANRAKECSSTNDQFAKGKERSYVATLESRVERLEKKIAETRMRRKSSITMMDAAGLNTPRRLSVDANNKPKDRRAARRKELSDIDELVSDFGFLAVNATARDYYGFTSAMSYARLVLAASSKEALPMGMKKELPARHAASALVQYYLQNIHVLLPIIEETSFFPSFNNVYDPSPYKSSPYDHWAVRMVLAIASAGQSQQRGDTYYADAVGHICAALEHAEVVLHPGSIWSIQAMLLLVVYATLDPNHFDSWTLIGVASRAMVDLGLHQDPSKSALTPRAKLELRRRVYYCVYVLDRSTSVVQTRAFSFSDDSAHVGLPFQSRVTSPSSPDNGQYLWLQSVEPALELIKLRQIQSSWYQQLFQSGRSTWIEPYSYIWVEYKKMSEWFERLPTSLMPSIRDFFEVELLYSYIYLLSPNPRCPEISEHAQKLLFEHCVAYSSKILHLTMDGSTHRTPLTFYDAIRVYMAGKQFITTLSQNLDILLRWQSGTPTSHYSNAMDAELDPLAPLPSVVEPPPIPPIDHDGSSSDPRNPINRAMSTISDFTSALSYFGHRFGSVGGISWRDRFQRESHGLLTQLQQRLQQQKQLEQGFCVWDPNRLTPQSNISNASPGAGTSYYPSPPNSVYTPEQIPGRAMSMAWPPMPGPHDLSELQVPGQNSASGDLSVGDLGLTQLTAWQTLPGGTMNSRFA